MEYKVYEVGASVGLSGTFCIDKKNNDLLQSIHEAIKKNEFVAIDVMSKDGSKFNDNPIQINPRHIDYIWELDHNSYPVHLGGKR